LHTSGVALRETRSVRRRSLRVPTIVAGIGFF
jgi:hypothetical protein